MVTQRQAIRRNQERTLEDLLDRRQLLRKHLEELEFWFNESYEDIVAGTEHLKDPEDVDWFFEMRMSYLENIADTEVNLVNIDSHIFAVRLVLAYRPCRYCGDEDTIEDQLCVRCQHEIWDRDTAQAEYRIPGFRIAETA